METQHEIRQLLNNYIQQYPGEKESTNKFIEFVDAFEGEQLFDRKNFTGHITASAFIINAAENALLLLKHKALNRWLQPGGHVDFTDASLLASALREAEEETGISAADLVPVTNTVFDFDSHFIPQNPKKQEASHFHHDVRFLFKNVHTKAITIAEEESDDSSWIPFSALENDAEFGRIVKKIAAR